MASTQLVRSAMENSCRYTDSKVETLLERIEALEKKVAELTTPHHRIGKSWTKEEEIIILADIEAGMTIAEIAVKQRRTPGGIRARLTRLACFFVEQKKMTLYEAAGRTGIRVARIQEVLNRNAER